MNDEQQRIIDVLERGQLVGRANGESRILGGTSIRVPSANEGTYSAALSLPHDSFSIERSASSGLWVGLVNLRAASLCVYASANPDLVAQGVVNYFALANASGLPLRQIREQFHQLERAYIQVFAESAIHAHLFWDESYGISDSWIVDTESAKPRAGIYLDLDTLAWILKGADRKKQASGTLEQVVQAAIKLRNMPAA